VPSETSHTHNAQKAAARAVFEVWSTGDLDRLDDLVAGAVVHHDPYDPHGGGGLSGMKETIRSNRALFPDLSMTVHDQLADGDRVATRWTAAMTYTAGSGERRSLTLDGITIDRFADGKIVEAWRSRDVLGLVNAMRMEGADGASLAQRGR
jgi:ketosteroid isomerase-like protein